MGQKPASHGPRSRLLNDAQLFARAISMEELTRGWSQVWANKGAAGGDNISVFQFQTNVMRRLSCLAADLRSGDYTPGPLRHVDIPKKNGGLRPLHIPCVGDRVVQTSVANVLMVPLEREFEEDSFAYRRGRSVDMAVRRVAALRSGGASFVVDADIERFFESVPHDLLLQRLGESLGEGPLSELVATWLEHGSSCGRGLAQGSPLSPLLANLYLDRLDEAFYQRNARIVRYADDFVILCQSEKGASGLPHQK